MATAPKLNVEPLDDWLVIEHAKPPGRTPGGILLPDSAEKKGTRGRVLAAGPGRLRDDGRRVEMEVEVGDLVLYGQWSGCEIEIEGKDYRLLRQTDVMARLPA